MGVVTPSADASRPTPAETPPIAPVSSASEQGAGQGAAGTKFRETLWFKKGDVDQMVADARAKVEAIVEAKKASEAAAAATGEDPTSLAERYTDDGTVTADDRKNFSLRSGGTSVAPPQESGGTVVPGARMTDSEVIDEIGGGKRLLIIGIAVAVAVALVAVVVVYARGKSRGDARALPAVTSAPAPVPAEAPAASPPPPPPIMVQPEVKAPTTAEDAKGAAPSGEPAAPKAKPGPTPRHHAVAKKHPAPVVKKPHR